MPDKPETLRANFARAAGVCKSGDPEPIAVAPRPSAEDPARDNENPVRPAMSMLEFYMNREERNLSAAKRRALGKAKAALCKRFGKAGADRDPD